MSLVAVQDVRFGYREREVLGGISLTVGAGEGVALLGANGAGKTTLFRLLMAFEHPWSGTIAVDGRSLDGLHPEDLHGSAGYLFQRPEDQLFRRTVRGDVRFGPERLGWDPARCDAAVANALDRLALADVAERHPYDLSLPRRRVVALAGVLAAAPRVLLLDEPTATLDRQAWALVVSVLRAQREAGVAVIAITHDTAFAAELCDRAVLIDGGRIGADGPLAEVLSRPGAPPLPPAVRLLQQLQIPTPSLRGEELAWALAARCRGPGR